MSEAEMIDLKEEKMQDIKISVQENTRLYRSHTAFFDKFMDLFGDKLIEMRSFCDKYDWDFDLTLDMARREI